MHVHNDRQGWFEVWKDTAHKASFRDGSYFFDVVLWRKYIDGSCK